VPTFQKEYMAGWAGFIDIPGGAKDLTLARTRGENMGENKFWSCPRKVLRDSLRHLRISCQSFGHSLQCHKSMYNKV
jgi:hypothetical protein